MYVNDGLIGAARARRRSKHARPALPSKKTVLKPDTLSRNEASCGFAATCANINSLLRDSGPQNRYTGYAFKAAGNKRGAAVRGIGLLAAAFILSGAHGGPGSWVLFGAPALHVGSPVTVLSPDRSKALESDLAGVSRAQQQFWSGLIAELQGLDPLAQLDLAQRFFAAYPYRSDWQRFGKADHWASLADFMQAGGDCEDFALARYRALVAAGFPASRLRVVLVLDGASGDDHAVLAARIGSTTYILDNRFDEPRPTADMPDYRVRYSINHKGVYRHFAR